MGKLILMDYAGRKVETDFDLSDENLNKVLRIDIEVITGDEIATIIFKDGTKKTYDSATDRMGDFYDGEYCLFNSEKDINLIGLFNSRKKTYDFYDLPEILSEILEEEESQNE